MANSVAKVDIDLRKTLYSEVYLTGGNTMISGFPERIVGELKKLVPKDTKVAFLSYSLLPPFS